jgi:alanine racemase
MYKEIYNSYLSIDLGKFRRNIQSLLDSLPGGAELIPMLKCNAYGMGLERIASVINEFSEIKTLAVAQVLEGIELRRLGAKQEILVAGAAATNSQIDVALENGLTLSAYRTGFIPRIIGFARFFGISAKLHIKINTGLNRLGVCPGEELDELISEIKEAGSSVQICGTFSHFSEMECSGKAEKIEEQYKTFMSAIAQLEKNGIDPGVRHICASAAYELHPEMALDAVRIGRRMYYDNPASPTGGVEELCSWRAPITNLRLFRAGEHIGYGDSIRLEKDSLIALIGVGYGDGLLRELAEAKAPVLIGGQRAKLIFACMDQCFIDATGIECSIGDEVTLLGSDKRGNVISGQEIASIINDEACTITASLGHRVIRIYE